MRERLAEDFAGRLRQLHRAVDLGFPEFTRYVRTLESQLATAILSRYPTAASFRGLSVKKLARIVYDGSHKIGEELQVSFPHERWTEEAPVNAGETGATMPKRSRTGKPDVNRMASNLIDGTMFELCAYALGRQSADEESQFRSGRSAW